MTFPVKLQVYDVSHGLARSISVALLGKYLDGLWHTGISVYGNEYFYGGNGIAYCVPGTTVLGHPTEIVDLGTTEVTQDVFHEYLSNLSQNTFSPESYHVIDHNCNTFSNEIAQFLTGKTTPNKVRNLSSDIMSTSFGKLIRPMIEKMQGAVSTGTFVGRHKEEKKDPEQPKEDKPTSSASTKENAPAKTPPTKSPNKPDEKKSAQDNIDLD